MRLLVVSNGFPPRGGLGTEFYTAELVRGLQQRGHDVSVLHPERGGTRPRYTLEHTQAGGVPITLLHNPGDPRKRFRSSFRDETVEHRFAEHLARERPDLVHFTYLLWGLSLRLPEVASRLGVPSVATLTDYGLLCHRGQMFDWKLSNCHGPHPAATCARCVRTSGRHDLPPLARSLRNAAAELLAALGGFDLVPTRSALEQRESEVRRALAALARLIAPTRSLLEVFARAGAPREKLVPLCYAFDEEPYRRAIGAERPARVRFGFLGQLAPHKGLECLLRAAVELERLAPGSDWELVLHGATGAGRHRLYRERALRGIDLRRVRPEPPFPPEEAPRVLAGLSALVAPSEWDENAPLAVLQARAAGLPVIATDVPGIAEIVRVPAQGRLVPVGDSSALARAMLAVVLGELRAPVAPGLALPLDQHLARLEALYAEVRAESSRG